ncbi:MAG: hypothetical protein KBC44_02695 [Candidatus Pacebacteria bacterium]|nr:hypothetical protein [Candidatus Paceibacterota bacterium]
MKVVLLVPVLLLFLIAKVHSQDSTHEFKTFLFKECPPKDSKDSLRISNFIDSIHKALHVKKIRIVSNSTATSHFAFGVMHINKLAIDSGKLFMAWIGELSHAWQFAKMPVRTSVRAFGGFISTFLGMFSLTKEEKRKFRCMVRDDKCPGITARFWVVYKRQYRSPRTFEGQAHTRIEYFLTELISKAFAGY